MQRLRPLPFVYPPFDFLEDERVQDDLIDGGVDKFHFYTLNRPELTRDVCFALGVTPEVKLEHVA